jgi:hypothetical protein
LYQPSMKSKTAIRASAWPEEGQGRCESRASGASLFLPRASRSVLRLRRATAADAKRTYFVMDKNGIVRWVKVEANALDLLNPDEVLSALKASGV